MGEGTSEESSLGHDHGLVLRTQSWAVPLVAEGSKVAGFGQ